MRRRPKLLTEAPTAFEPAGKGAGGAVVLAAVPGTRRGRERPTGGSAPGSTDEPAELVTLDSAGAATDPVVRARARQIAARLSVPRPPRDTLSSCGSGDLASLPYRGGSDEIDLDRTIEVLAERPVPEDEDIIVRDRVRTRRSVVLLVDASGSMSGERVRTAAATVAALAGELHRDHPAVLAFWSDAAVLVHLGQRVEPLTLLDQLLALPARA